jgi:formylmethanofuran dehydrogenase subunit D
VSQDLILITGRTLAQGRALHGGKDPAEYGSATSLVEMNAEDMAALGLEGGQSVLLRTRFGQAEGTVQAGRLPRGIVFLPLGPAAGQLVAQETEGTGMPLLKGLSITVCARLDPRQRS